MLSIIYSKCAIPNILMINIQIQGPQENWESCACMGFGRMLPVSKAEQHH